MIKPILFIIFFCNPIIAFSEGRMRLQFREIARVSAILNQCETPEINRNREKINKFSQTNGLILAKKENLNKEQISKIVAKILVELDYMYEDEIPSNICNETFLIYKKYKD